MTASGRPLGATRTDDGTHFAIWSSVAARVELCLYDAGHQEMRRVDLDADAGGVWRTHVPGVGAGQRYGYRVHGPFDAQHGQRCRPSKLLIDPYARALSGDVRWDDALFDANDDDSAAVMPKAVVCGDAPDLSVARPVVPWSEMIIYETNVRGYTMRHPDVPDTERGRFRGMCNGTVLEYLKALGVTSIELMPVFEFIDEPFLAGNGLRNFWGYNTINYFTPCGRYAGDDARSEFVEMVDAIHDAGLEVILDVAYNHTGESGGTGPTLSFRGIDNLAYYRTEPDDQGQYINDTGTGNTINADHPRVRELIVASLGYWSKTMGVDGFRFDLATITGRNHGGFSREHAFFAELDAEPALADVKLIAEPWDPGPGGYQLGSFPDRWAEWNDRYRDSVRRFWRGDAGETAEFAKRLHGSADIFEAKDRGPCSSINFVSAHDGFTLADTVSYKKKHNEANSEANKDGHAHNFSANYGVEGLTRDAKILAIRRQQRLNMLATLLLSQGTPMLLAGDEIGNSQGGNNNAYAQDNEIGWIDWSGLESDPEFLAAIRALIDLRHAIPLFRQPSYVHGAAVNEVGWGDIEWLTADGQPMTDRDWEVSAALSMVLTHVGEERVGGAPSVVLLINGTGETTRFTLLPAGDDVAWQIRFVSAARDFRPVADNRWDLPGRSIVCVALEDV